MEQSKKTKAVIFSLNHAIYLNLLKELAKREDLDILAVFWWKNIKQEPNFKFKTVKHKNFLRGFSFLNYIPRFEREMKEINSDVIIAKLYYSFASYQVYRYAKKSGIKYFILAEEKRRGSNMTSWLVFKLWDLTLGKKMLNYSEKVICWTNTSKGFMQGLVKDKGKVKAISPGIETSVFYRKDRKRYRPEGKVRFLMVGKIKECKDHLTLINALKEVKEEINFEMTFLGSGRDSFVSMIKDKINEYGLKNLITFADKVPHNEIPNFYNKHDVLILPSKSEAVGMVVPEAMACGLPVIVSDSVGAKDYVVEEETGYIFETGKHKDLAEKMKEISKKDLKEMSDECVKQMKNYDTSKTSENFYRILK